MAPAPADPGLLKYDRQIIPEILSDDGDYFARKEVAAAADNLIAMITPLFSTGETVHVRAAGDRTLTRRVVRDLGEIVLICKEDDFERALSLGINPPSMAFRKDDVYPLLPIGPRSELGIDISRSKAGD